MTYKKKADCTPEEWEEYLKYKRDLYKEKHKNDKNFRKGRRKYSGNAKERMRQACKKWRDNNKEKNRKKALNWYHKNKKRVLENAKKNKNRRNELKRKRYAENKEKFREMSREWYKNHREEEKLRHRKSKQKTKNNPVKFATYGKQLTIDEDPIADKDGFLMCRDFHTKEYFYPTRTQVNNRIMSLNGVHSGENHLYASEESKQACPVYRARVNSGSTTKKLFPIDPFWRKTVIERANGHCERCGKASDVLHAHHIIPKGVCGMFEEDFDNGIALCPECHLGEGGVHDIDGCRLHELAAEKSEAV